MQQARLSKFRDQLMEVKTNREYQAMQKEIETAQHEIQKQEDRLLEQMIEFDEVTAARQAGRTGLPPRPGGERGRAAPRWPSSSSDAAGRHRPAGRRAGGARGQDQPAHPRGVRPRAEAQEDLAVAPVRDGRCSACQIRIRPQTVNELRRNEIIFQCDSCHRILYYEIVPAAPAQAAPRPAE